MFFPRNIASFIAGTIPSFLLYRIGSPVIIYPFYHTVSDTYLPHINPLYRPKNRKEFVQDIDFMASLFEAKSMEEIFFYFQKPELLKKNAFHLSFDDGLRGVYEMVLPLLLQKGIPATIFINSNFVDNRQLFYRHKAALLIDKLNNSCISKITYKEIKNRLNTNFTKNSSLQSDIRTISFSKENLLNEIAPLLDVNFQEYLKKNRPYLAISELEELQKKGFTIGAHSLNHPPFGALTESEQIRQTIESCDYVKKIFGETRAYFSFPFSEIGVQDSFFNAIKNKVDLCFGISGISIRRQIALIGRIDMERNGRNAGEIINKAFLKYQIKKW
jgi:peptidoglycan/xylan/chitin deacetylase (PgdA/CDA1 family)